MTESARGWRTWDRFEWNQRLLAHYFKSADIATEPVRRLDVSWRALAAVTNDSQASVEEVKQHFADRLRKWLGSKSLIESAVDAGSHHGMPTYFVHLFVTCLVAAEAQEDQDNLGQVERDFRDGLETLLGEAHKVGQLGPLPVLWERLATWLGSPAQHGRYRRLELPSVGRETLIGYSKRLVFPRVRDQLQLARLLDNAELLMEDPPARILVERLSGARREMSNDIEEAYDEFCRAVRGGATDLEIADHRFLIAVNSAARNPFLVADSSGLEGHITILGQDFDDSFEFIVAATSSEPFRGAAAELDDYLPSDWAYRLVSFEGKVNPLEQILSGVAASPLRWLVGPGVIPFVVAGHGMLELLKRGQLSDAVLVLLRQDVVASASAAFGIDDRRVVASGIDGWFAVRKPGLRQLTAEELAAAGLAKALVLHHRPARNSLGLRGGYEVVGDYLGFRSTTPWVDAPRAVSVTADLDGADLPLTGGNGRWFLPDSDLFGILTVTAEYPDGGMLRKRAALIAEPTNAAYKQPSDPSGWMQETLASMSVRSDVLRINESECEVDIGDAVHSVYLGATVGEFHADPAGAVWELTSFGAFKYVRPLDPNALTPPVAKVVDGGSCRRWRRLLEHYESSAETEEIKRAMSAARGKMHGLADVPGSPAGHRARATEFPDPDPGCRLVQAVLGSYCCRVTGMSLRYWRGLLQDAFGLDHQLVRRVQRAWVEAGFVDELAKIRWQGRMVFARNPFILTFMARGARFASIEGLVMPSRLDILQRLAEELGLATSMNNSPSKYLPRRLMLSSADSSLIDEFARRSGLASRFLSASPTAEVMRRDLDGRKPPLGYQQSRAFPTFPVPDGATITMHSRQGSPGYWVGRGDQRAVWSYSPEATQFRLAQLSGAKTAAVGVGNEIQIDNAFMPLSVARWVSSVAGVCPGPIGDQYVNPAPSRRLAERIVSLVDAIGSEVVGVRLDD